MRVYTLECEFCSLSFVYGTNVSRELAVRGYVVCPSCAAWNPFVQPVPTASAAGEVDQDGPAGRQRRALKT